MSWGASKVAVSQPNVRVYLKGHHDSAVARIQEGFRQLALLDDAMAFNEKLTGHKLQIDTRTSYYDNGDMIRCHRCFGHGYVYIHTAGGDESYYVLIEELKASLHLYVDPIVCKSITTGETIDCTAENKCTGAGAEFGDCEATRMFRRVQIERVAGTLSFTEKEFSYYDSAGVLRYDTEDISPSEALNGVCKSLSKTSTHGAFHCYTSWSKTLDQYIAHAILYYDDMMEMNFWCVAVDFNGKQYGFKSGSQTYYSWPPGGYRDVFWVTNTDPYNTTPGYKAFDLWKEEVREDNGDYVDHCFLSMTADTYDRVFVWDLTLNEYEYFDLTWRQEFAQENGYYWPHFPDDWIDKHIRLIGLAKRTAYWAVQQHDFSIPVGQPNAEDDAIGRVYWQDDEDQGSAATGTSECGFEFAIFNEFTRVIEWMDSIACYEDCEFVEGGFSGPHCYGTEHTLNINGVQRGSYFVSGDEGVAGYVCPRSSSCAGEVYYFSIYGCPLQFVGDNSVRYCPPEDSWCCGHTSNFTYWYWDCNSEVYECIVSGLHSGSYVRKRRTRTCKYVSNNCNAYLDPYCVTTNDSGVTSCGYCTHEYYTSYALSGRIDRVSILPSGIGSTFSGAEANGEIAICDNPYGDHNTYTETDYDDLYGAYNSQYGNSAWPFYPPFAIVVEAQACDEIIERTETKYRKRDNQYVSTSTVQLSDDEIIAKCAVGGDHFPYVILRNNDGDLIDSYGNYVNPEPSDFPDFFFLVQDVERTFLREDNVT
jgi:hypothetical protein